MSASAKQQPIHVFIDTSAFLSFFAFTNDDIEQLRKLKRAIDDGRLRLHLPQQVVDEFNRNREGKINEALGGFAKSDLKSLPRLLATYPEAMKYLDAVQNLKKARDQLVSAARKDALEKGLPADKLFAELCECAGVYEPTDAVYSRALRRHQVGNPPGKADAPLGDRLNWESLLATVPKGAHLHIVTKDDDYASPLGEGTPNRFLADEWAERKGGKLYLHAEVRIFFKQSFKIEFESLRQEKQAAVEALLNAGSFSSTHAAIQGLEPLVELLEPEDIVALAEAAVNNTQINWIAQDDDVRSFFTNVMLFRLDQLEPDLRTKIVELFGLGGEEAKSEDDEGADLPF